ncbi:uncharacterized protein LOC143069009 [Mytilus galloprovincialis]|uniref:uncharacterized protein LOC143069009 n=1 Tax=Mytilus galloprovincialis TaxID=29158 RepID=UPI003F7C47BA
MVFKHTIVLLGYLFCVNGHGFLLDPPQRSSLWRIYPGHFPPNYNDNALNCGGRLYQWQVKNGRCGSCGDPIDDVRQHEDNGLYDSGFISRNYTSGSDVILTVRITSNHKGWFEFKICPRDHFQGSLDTCLENHILEIDGRGIRYELGQASGDIEVKVRLPPGLTCNRCILQWKYNTGNSWGCNDSGCCVGCGPQEQFYNCADIGIYNSDEPYDFGEIPLKDPLSFLPKPLPTSKPKVKTCHTSPEYRDVVGMEKWCQDTCPFCPKSHCMCTYI